MSARADGGGIHRAKRTGACIHRPTTQVAPLCPAGHLPRKGEIGLRLHLGREPNEKAGRFRPASIIHTCMRSYLIIGSNSLTDFFASP